MSWIWNIKLFIYLKCLPYINGKEYCWQLWWNNYFWNIVIFFRMFILHLQMTLNITFSEWVNLLSIYRVQNKFSRLDISDSYVGIFLYSCYLNSWLMILNFYPTFNVRWYLWKYDIYIQWVYKEDILVNIAYNYVSISVYFRKLWFKESQLSYNQHEILGNLY